MRAHAAVRRAQRHEGGFTLLEVLVVLAILGVSLAVGGLAFTSLKLPRESGLVQKLRRTRSQAIQTGRPAVIV